jgi:hypothetical protein
MSLKIVTTESLLFNIAFVLAVFLRVVLPEFDDALTTKFFDLNTKKDPHCN